MIPYFGIRGLATTGDLMDISTRDYDAYDCQSEEPRIDGLTLMVWCCCGLHFQRYVASDPTERGYMHSLP